MAGGIKTEKLGSNLYPVLFFCPNGINDLPVNNIEKTQSYILKDNVQCPVSVDTGQEVVAGRVVNGMLVVRIRSSPVLTRYRKKKCDSDSFTCKDCGNLN
jgi:hypothetical protein